MTNIRFVGDLPLWAGVALALLIGVLSWRYYRRESFDLPHRLRWVLPLLRSLAFLLGVMVLTQPVLHHRTVIGELGRVKIYVDASQSMGLLDRHLSAGRKLLIAEQQGWLQKERVDARLLHLADTLGDARAEILAGLQNENVTQEDVQQLRNGLIAKLKSTLAGISEHPGLLRSENAARGDKTAAGQPVSNSGSESTEQTFAAQLVQPLEAITVSSEQSAVDDAVGQLLAVCEAIPQFEQQIRQAFDGDVQKLIDSGDESVRAALTMFDETPRWRRAERILLDAADALFVSLQQHHNVEILALHDQQAIELLDGLSTAEPPKKFSDLPDAATSDLASGISASQQAVQQSELVTEDVQESRKPNTAIVLLSDGQHNSGPSPLQTARLLGSQGVAFYPVSLGASAQAPDIAVTGLEHPQMVFQKDRVRGAMIVRDWMPVGRPMVAEIIYKDDVLWQKQLLTENAGERRIEFEFGVDEIVEQLGGQFESDVQRHAVALAMTASITPLQGEAEPNNNQRMLRFAAITENHRLLILDGRSRWETRYLRNVFERDSQWDVDVIIAGPGTDDETLPRGDGRNLFPETREGLFEYDLIIFGEVPAGIFAEHEFQWIREFVETRGGGIIFIDGQRRRLQQFTEQDLGSLLPVTWLSAEFTTQPTMLQLTETGSRQPALAFEVETQANQRFWTELPPPHTLNNVEVLPGAEVLVEAVVDGSALPAMVTRNYGAGRVLYLASDETWRWRYKAADTYHQRIWNQLAKYVMPRPFATSDEYVSVDTGPVSYQNGDSVDIRIRLMGLDGNPATGATVDALVWKDGRMISTASLTPDADVPGIYRGSSGTLSEGEYEVSIRASGFSQEALQARGQFVVLPPESGELENTACNESLLKQMAAESGGVYLREEQIGQLSDLLSPLSSGRVVESDTEIWKSYWWFGAIVILLTLEWFLRKRAGLL